MMTSTDREILLKISGRLVRIESRMDKLESRMNKIETQQEILAQEIIGLKIGQGEIRGTLTAGLWYGGIGFAVLAAVITFASIYVPMLLKKNEPQSAENSEGKIQPVIISSQPTISFDVIEKIVGLIRNQDSSKPINDTRPSPDNTASS